MAIFQLPTSAELRKVEQDLLPTLTQNDPIFSVLPIENMDTDLIAFEQEDSFQGLQALRGLNGQPGNVVKTGFQRYEIKPGVYGEYTSIDEPELTKRRKIGTLGIPVDIRDLVADRQRFLLHRRISRIRQICWTLLTSGTFSVSNASGSVVHTDAFNPQVYNAAIHWSDPLFSKPLTDVRNVALLYRGYSVQFDSNDFIYANRATINKIFVNLNQQDLYGHRRRGLGTVGNVKTLNELLRDIGLPQFVVMDDTYGDNNPIGALLDSSGNPIKTYFDPLTGLKIPATSYTHNFIPDNVLVMVGRRTDKKPIGKYAVTRNATNKYGKPGFYTIVVDSKDTGNPVPRSIQVHDGQNSAPVLTYPSAFVIINC